MSPTNWPDSGAWRTWLYRITGISLELFFNLPPPYLTNNNVLLSLVISYPSLALKVSRSRADRHNNRVELRPYDPSHLSCFELHEYGRSLSSSTLLFRLRSRKTNTNRHDFPRL